MASPSSSRLSSCIPCSKRKVRCDRGEPCTHCKRRKTDTCAYPQLRGRYPASPSASNGPVEAQQARIAQLTQYITSTGGERVQAPLTPTTNTTSPVAGSEDVTLGNTASADNANKTGCDVAPSRRHPEAGLVEHDKLVTYLETYVLLSTES